MRRTTTWAVPVIATIGLLGMVAGPLVIRTAFRYYVLQKALSKIPYAEERLAVFPKSRTLTTSTSIQPINLGYATFDIGSTGPIYIVAMGDGAVLEVTNEDFGVILMPPSAPQRLTDSDSLANAKAGSHLARYLQISLTNFVAAQVEVEETRILPISQIALMSKDDFFLYTYKLIGKAGLTWGSNETWSFTTPRIRGIVRVGHGPDDRRFAAAGLVSLDGTRNVGMQVVVLPGSHKDIALALDPILASFQFTIDKINSRDEICGLISQAGILMRPSKY